MEAAHIDFVVEEGGASHYPGAFDEMLQGPLSSVHRRGRGSTSPRGYWGFEHLELWAIMKHLVEESV